MLCAAALGLGSCATQREALQPQNFTDVYLLSRLGEFDINSTKENAPAVARYFKDYYEVIPDLRTYSGVYYSGDELLAAHLLRGTRTDAGTVILIHGYNGTMIEPHFEYFAQQFIKNGFRVVLLNLPGHEFSGGYRSAVNSFADYGAMVVNFLSQNKKSLGPAVYAVGISTGSVAIFDALRTSPEVRGIITKSALLVPFIRMRAAGLLEFGSYLSPSINSGRRGPMQIYNLSTRWIRQAGAWQKEVSAAIKDSGPLDGKNIFIAFAEQDKAIQVAPSRDFYSQAFSAATVKTYAGQDHMFSKAGYEDVRSDVMQFFGY